MMTQPTTTNTPPPRTAADETEYRLATARPTHARAIARLHKDGIHRGFLASLGEGFLAQLYEAMLDNEDFGVFVYLCGDEVVGFCTVTSNTGTVFKSIIRRKPFGLGLRLLPKLTTPARLMHVIENLLYSRKTLSVPLPDAELLSFAVDTGHRRKGMAKRLVEATLRWLAERRIDAMRVSCTVGLDSNPLFDKLGFHLAQVTEHHGQKVNVFTTFITADGGIDRSRNQSCDDPTTA